MKTLKAIYNHFEQIKELLVVGLILTIISLCLWSVIFPRDASVNTIKCSENHACYNVTCIDIETQKKCKL